MKSRFATLYTTSVLPELKKRFGYKNVNAAPRVEKVVINIGVGRLARDEKVAEHIRKNLELISGQRPVIRKARKSIASFKLREGMTVGMMVTLRGKRMYDFLDKLVNVILPRIRDFRGLTPTSIDQRGNFSLGLQEQGIFPEIGSENLEPQHGLQVTVQTTAKSYDEGLALLQLLGFPFIKE
ncbi:MAG: 50S ribosomal protein L5 [Patescibacteria group bacterium]|jgi:large subunit ribosomal protein L5